MERNTFPNIPHELNLWDREAPTQLKALIQNKKCVFDIGCGHGDFLIDQTVREPDTFFIGIEISRKRVFKTSERLSKRSITNYAVIDSEGELALKLLVPSNSIDELHVNFPDPWLRKRHWKNRIFTPSFLIQAIRTLKKGGALHFVTDVREYADQVALLLKEFPGLENSYAHDMEINLYDHFPTLFYKKMSPLRPIHYIRFIKKASI